MSIADICQRQVITIAADASLKDAAASMREHHVGALVVVDAADSSRVAGVVTDRDLAIEVLAGDVNAAGVRIGQLANGSLAAVSAHGGIGDAVAAMQDAGVRRLLVIDDGGRVVGFLSSDDLLDAVASELDGLARALRCGIARESAQRGPLPASQAHPVFLPLGMPGMR